MGVGVGRRETCVVGTQCCFVCYGGILDTGLRSSCSSSCFTPTVGCSFRYRMVGIDGWTLTSAPSKPAATFALPALTPSAVRLQLRLDAAVYATVEPQAAADLLAADLSAALDLPVSLVVAREVRSRALSCAHFHSRSRPDSQVEMTTTPSRVVALDTTITCRCSCYHIP